MLSITSKIFVNFGLRRIGRVPLFISVKKNFSIFAEFEPQPFGLEGDELAEFLREDSFAFADFAEDADSCGALEAPGHKYVRNFLLHYRSCIF